MSAKRRRAESSRSAVTYDQNRFVSQNAAERFERIIDKKTLVLERGLRPDPQLDGALALMIAERDWGTFVAPPGPAVIPVVKEFYANALDRNNFVVQVRGRPVSFSGTAINEYFNIPFDGEGDEYEDNHDELDEVIQRLAKPGTTWALKANTDEKVSFPHAALSRYGKAWYSFICANLMPTRHQNDVTRERALLLHGIVKQQMEVDGSFGFYKVDVGMIIQQSIEKCLRGSTSGGLPHGSLITGLCQQAGVQWRSSEPLQQPMATIDHLTIEKYRAWEGAISHPRGEGYIMEPPSSSPPLATGSFSVPPIPSDLQRLQRRITRQNMRLAQRQATLFDYNIGAFTALADAFSRFSPHDPVLLPTPPVLPGYPPSDEDDNDEHGGS